MSKTKITISIALLLLVTLACNALATPNAAPLPTMTVEAVSTQTVAKIPLTEAEVPRVSLEDAKAAFENGTAVIVDVRSQEAYAASHIPGAINIPLEGFETNPTGLGLDQNQWIITYCT